VSLAVDTPGLPRNLGRLLKKAHLLRWLARAALRRTGQYASRLASLAALHLDLLSSLGECEYSSNLSESLLDGSSVVRKTIRLKLSEGLSGCQGDSREVPESIPSAGRGPP
jgi:hypothetical protein